MFFLLVKLIFSFPHDEKYVGAGEFQIGQRVILLGAVWASLRSIVLATRTAIVKRLFSAVADGRLN
jgi:hypothetical protein